MNYTQKYQLCQWEETDRILRTDFNADNARLEAALLARPCQFYTSSYVGAAQQSHTLLFPKKPMLVFILSSIGFAITAYGFDRICFSGVGDSGHVIYMEWSGYTCTWSDDRALDLSLPGTTYSILALLDTDT